MIDNPKAADASINRSNSRIRLVSSSSNPSPPLYTHAMEPASFGVSISDLLEELEQNPDSYRVSKRDVESESITIHSLSNRLRLTLDNLRAQFNSNPPSTQSILFASVCLGLRRIETDPNIKELSDTVANFNRHDKDGDPLEIFTHSFLNLSIGMKNDEPGSRFNLPVTSQIKGRISRIWCDTGMHINMISVHAAYACLIEQPSTGEQSVEKWTTALNDMSRSVRMKLAMSKVLMAELESTTWKKD